MSKQKSSEDDGFDVKAIIDGTALICINVRKYPAGANMNMIDILKAEETCSEKPVTELLRKEWQDLQSRGVHEKCYNIHFIYRIVRDSKDGFTIDVRPTGRIR